MWDATTGLCLICHTVSVVYVESKYVLFKDIILYMPIYVCQTKGEGCLYPIVIL